MALHNLLSGHLPFGPCAVGVGTFDGVHVGHQVLIRALRERARAEGLPGVIFTFDHSPKRLLDPANFLGEITTPEEKFSLLLATGLDHVVFRPFEPEFALLSPEDFVREILVRQLQARVVMVGFNFGFGLHRAGTADSLCELLRRQQVRCQVIPAVRSGDALVSSTLIRARIMAGDMDDARRLLGREYLLAGSVVHGDHRGRELGFRTANLLLEGSTKVLPPRGVYAGFVDTAFGTHPAMINIGVRPTFERTTLLLEAHLLDFDADLYHTIVRVRFLQRLRDEIRFEGGSALVEQMHRDLAATRQLCAAPLREQKA